jgi:hypothetical protein
VTTAMTATEDCVQLPAIDMHSTKQSAKGQRELDTNLVTRDMSLYRVTMQSQHTHLSIAASCCKDCSLWVHSHIQHP